MTLPKFIITLEGVFRLAMVNQHKDLLKPGDQCIGGGYYHFDFVSNRIILNRESYEQGILRLRPSQVASVGGAESTVRLSWYAYRLCI